MDSEAQSLDPQPKVHGGYSFREFISRERLSHLDTQVHQETASEECRGPLRCFPHCEGGRKGERRCSECMEPSYQRKAGTCMPLNKD